ncbi:MAG: GDP-mannose 4,6-dehydratase [Proteobacteria bacterium]|nr:GDP-mannose 4,6-dehydratase [Pseudomonadota bacterium]
MAAESHVDRSIKCANDFIQTNIVGTHNLLQASLHYYKKVKKDLLFIHLSTDEVFGTLGVSGKFNEDSPYRPNSPYAASKASSDLLARAYYKTYGLPLIIIHPSNNYGPQQYPEKFIPLMILNALNHKTLPLYGNGLQIRDWLYVEDHVKALHTIILQGKIGESYCISAGNEITNLNLAQTLCTLLDHMHPSATLKSYKDLITFVTDRPGHDFRYATDASKLKHHTQWQPQTEFQEGLKKTIQWYINHKLEFSRVCLQN